MASHLDCRAAGLTPAAEHSAERVADALRAAGASYGILLTSDAKDGFKYPVTRDDILQAVVDLKHRIRLDGATAPRIVFYFMGHGYGDEVNRSLYLLPGDLGFTKEPTQTSTVRLMHLTVFDKDVISALVNFRLHRTMRYLDDFFPTQVMPDPMDLRSFLRVARRQEELIAIDERQRRNGEYLPEGNPPVPFLILFDNCYGGVITDLVGRLPVFSWMLDGMIGQVLADGAALYAAKPGSSIGDLRDPGPLGRGESNDGGNKRIGYLALDLVLALSGRNEDVPMLFESLHSKLLETLPRDVDSKEYPKWQPYTPPTMIEDDVRTVEFIPRSSGGGLGEIDRRYGSGDQIKICCSSN